MRILFLTFHLPLPEEPGAFRPWMEACLMRDLGCTVTVVTSAIQYMTGEDLRGDKRGWCTEEQCEGVRILRVWGVRRYRTSLWRRLLHYMIYAGLSGLAALTRAGKADRIFIGTDPIFITPIARTVARIKRAALVLDERDLYPETALALGVLKPGVRSRLISAWQRAARQRARRLLAATPGIRTALVELGVSPSAVRVLYNADAYIGNDNCLPANFGEPPLERYFPDGATFIVVYAGGMGMANDIDTLLEAAEILKTDREIGFVLAGEGERRREYEERIHVAGLNVAMTGPLPRRTARKLISEAGVCVHMYPDRALFSGALASKVLDYLALGKPVVFCGKGDTVDVIRAADAGVCCSPGDATSMAAALLWLRNHPEDRSRMGKSARKWFTGHMGKNAALATMAWALEKEEAA